MALYVDVLHFNTPGEFATYDGWTQAQLNEVLGANIIESDHGFKKIHREVKREVI